jgi:hypothetical protein
MVYIFNNCTYLDLIGTEIWDEILEFSSRLQDEKILKQLMFFRQNELKKRGKSNITQTNGKRYCFGSFQDDNPTI